MSRPRKLSDEKELELVRWWNARGTFKGKARELGISTKAIQSILRRRGAMRLNGCGQLRPDKARVRIK